MVQNMHESVQLLHHFALSKHYCRERVGIESATIIIISKNDYCLLITVAGHPYSITYMSRCPSQNPTMVGSIIILVIHIRKLTLPLRLLWNKQSAKNH